MAELPESGQAGELTDVVVTPAMIAAGASVARDLVDYEWAALSAEQQRIILTAIYRAMEAGRRV